MTVTNSTHYKFAANFGVDFQPEESRVYGGFKVDIPVAVVDGATNHQLQEAANHTLSAIDYAHLQMFALGAYQPLTGFMSYQDVESVVRNRCLSDFLPWEQPVFIATAKKVSPGSKLNLCYRNTVIAQLGITDTFHVKDGGELGIADNHYVVAGDLLLFMRKDGRLAPELVDWNRLLDRSLETSVGAVSTAAVGLEAWRTDDEHLIKAAIDTSDRIFLHPVSRPVAGSDEWLPAELARQGNELVIAQHYPAGRVMTSPVPSVLGLDKSMLLQLGITYQNLGCKRLLVVSDTRLSKPEEWSALDIDLLLLEPGFHCVECGGHATARLCNHGPDARSRLHEVEIVNKLVAGEQLPAAVARPEVARMLSRQLSVKGGSRNAASGQRHIFPHASKLNVSTRNSLNGHRSAVLWMTGLSGSGKSTLATHLEKELILNGHQACVLDGDTLRNGLCSDLGFSPEARRENLRRAAETAKLMKDNGMLVLASFISPFSNERKMLRDIVGDQFLEVYVEASLADCERRDPKGLYQRARAGLIPEFTGVSSPYEEPVNPDLRVNTSMMSVNEAVKQLLFELANIGLLKKSGLGVVDQESSSLIDADHNSLRRN